METGGFQRTSQHLSVLEGLWLGVAVVVEVQAEVHSLRSVIGSLV